MLHLCPVRSLLQQGDLVRKSVLGADDHIFINLYNIAVRRAGVVAEWFPARSNPKRRI